MMMGLEFPCHFLFQETESKQIRVGLTNPDLKYLS